MTILNSRTYRLKGACVLALNHSPHNSLAGRLVTDSSEKAGRLVQRLLEYYTCPKYHSVRRTRERTPVAARVITARATTGLKLFLGQGCPIAAKMGLPLHLLIQAEKQRIWKD